LIVTHSYGLNGAALKLMSILAYWTKDLGWEVEALVSKDLFNAYGEQLISAGIKPIYQTDDHKVYDFLLINTLLELRFVDLFYRKIPIILWVHEGTTFLRSYQSTPLELTKTFSKCDLIVFQTAWQSEVIYKSFIHEIPSKRVALIPSGVYDKQKLAIGPVKKLNYFKVINVGTVYPRKHQMDLALACISLAKKYPIKASFVGDLSEVGAYGPDFSAFLNQYPDTLLWKGGIKDISILNTKISESTMACFPSDDETFNVSAMEAALQRIPIVLADLAVYNYIGWIDGVNCLKFPVGDIQALERTLERLINSIELSNMLANNALTLAKSFDVPSFHRRVTEAVCRVRPLLN